MREWQLQPLVVAQIWERFDRVEVYLFVSRANTHCSLNFSMADQDVQSGTDIACFGEGALARVISDSVDNSVANKVIVC